MRLQLVIGFLLSFHSFSWGFSVTKRAVASKWLWAVIIKLGLTWSGFFFLWFEALEIFFLDDNWFECSRDLSVIGLRSASGIVLFYSFFFWKLMENLEVEF